MKKRGLLFLLSMPTTLCLKSQITIAQNDPLKHHYSDLYSDTWVATDALGRTMPGIKNISKTENSRVSYPLNYIENSVIPSIGNIPRIFFF